MWSFPRGLLCNQYYFHYQKIVKHSAQSWSRDFFFRQGGLLDHIPSRALVNTEENEPQLPQVFWKYRLTYLDRALIPEKLSVAVANVTRHMASKMLGRDVLKLCFGPVVFSGSVGKPSFILPNKVHMCTKKLFIPSSSDAKWTSASLHLPCNFHFPIMRDDASTMGNEVCPFRATFPHIRGGSGVCKVTPRRHDAQGSCPRNRWNMSSVNWHPSWNIPS